ncbi:MAG TPA: hypothetical protein VF943_12655 [Burkholderiales bacterium]
MVSTPLDIPLARAPRERSIYTWAALAALFFVFAGFARTYYLKAAFGAPDLSALKHLHGLVMTAWFVFFFVQVRLVATGRTAVHRRLGVAGVFLALLVLVVGTALGIASARAGAAPTGVAPLVFLVLPIGEMLVFAVLVTAAILMRKRGPYHKRLMLLASVAMLTPAMARLPFDFVQAGGPLAFFALTDAVILACIAFDTLKNRRLHPVFGAGLAFIVVGQIGRLAFSQTAAWMTFAKWLVA